MTPSEVKLLPIHEVYLDELRQAIELYSEEVATLRRIKEITHDQEIKDAITGIIQDELTLINSYRRELL